MEHTCHLTDFSFFREIILGEHHVFKDPDCPKCPSNITRYAAEFHVHENYDKKYKYNDIALIRLSEPIPLFDEDPRKSLVKPVCLPIDENHSSRFLQGC